MIVGVPMRGGLTTQEWGFCLALQNYPMNTNRIYTGIKRRPVDEARNRIVRIAKEENAKYIWFLDDDVGAPNYAVRKLVYDLEQSDDDTLVAGGIYGCKAHPVEPCVFVGNGGGPFWKWKKGEVFEVTGIGTGCLLIDMRIFDRLPKPEIRTIPANPSNDKDTNMLEVEWWFNTVNTVNETGEIVGLYQTDDLFFCDNVIANGMKILADGNVLCCHWDISVDPPIMYELPLTSYPFQPTP